MATPPSLPRDFKPDVAAARAVVDERACESGRTWLDPIEVTRLLAAYSIPIAPALLARDADEAAAAAAAVAGARASTVVAKILSPDIVHKSEVGGVRLNLTSERAVREAVADILARARAARPDARISGVTIHPMILRPKARELIAGIADDPTFGPVIVFGRGGTAVEVIGDKALALPPLDLKLARELIARTRVSRVLKAYRDVPAADERRHRARAGQAGATRRRFARDARARSQSAAGRRDRRHRRRCPGRGRSGRGGAPRPVGSIRASPSGPIPRNGNDTSTLRDGTRVLVRPVRPEDEPFYGPFFAAVTPQDLRLRFFAPVKEFGHAFVARFTQIDYARAMAFIAIEESSGEMLGVVRLHANANYDSGEYADPGPLRPEGSRSRLAADADDHRIRALPKACGPIEGQVLSENTTMLAMCRELGFDIALDPR